MNRVDLIQIDVTSDESVKKAVETVRIKFEDSEPLYGLVNNAGGATGSSREILQLNTYSVRRVTEAFLPLIQKNKGTKYIRKKFFQYLFVQVVLFRFHLELLQLLSKNVTRRFKVSF